MLLSTFRLPTQIHTRSANAKWLDELAHTNPVWIHPRDAGRLGVARTGDLVRVETDIGHFVAKAWLTEGIRPGVVACSHHMGRWRLDGQPRGAGGMMATVDLRRDDDGWTMQRRASVAPYASADPDSQRIWWSDTGVHQNLTFAVHPDPISGHALLAPGGPGPAAGPAISTGTSRSTPPRPGPSTRNGCGSTRPAGPDSPGALRRPPWLMRPLKPTADSYRVPAPAVTAGRLTRQPGDAAGRSAAGGAARRPARSCCARSGRCRPARRRTATPVTASLGLPAPTAAEHTGVFVLAAPPHAAIHLGADGKLGGEATGSGGRVLAGDRPAPAAGG